MKWSHWDIAGGLGGSTQYFGLGVLSASGVGGAADPAAKLLRHGYLPVSLFVSMILV